MGVSKNRGAPKSSILIGFSIINHQFWGAPIFGNTHIQIIISGWRLEIRVPSPPGWMETNPPTEVLVAVQSPAFAGVDVRVCALDLEVILGLFWKNRGTMVFLFWGAKSNAVARSWRCFHDWFTARLWERLRFCRPKDIWKISNKNTLLSKASASAWLVKSLTNKVWVWKLVA